MEQNIRVVAVDEDGTFLYPGGLEYDRERFDRIYNVMRKRDIRFVVATGNQIYQVRDYFSHIANEIAYVTSNGAFVTDGTQEVRRSVADASDVALVLGALQANPNIYASLVGGKGSYIEKGAPQWFFDEINLYSHRAFWVDSLAEIDDTVGIFSLIAHEDEAPSTIAYLNKVLQGRMTVVDTGTEDGHTYIDVIQPGVTKADGLRVLLERWGIDPRELVAFGDSENDIEMLKMAGQSYAMANAYEHVKLAATHIAPSNSEQGVLCVLEDLLGIEPYTKL